MSGRRGTAAGRPRAARRAGAVAAAIALAFCGAARADDGRRPPARPESAPTPEAVEPAATERSRLVRKRPVPDLDRRAPPEAPPGEAALWVPRALLFPLHVLFEYVLRRPLGLALTESERVGLGAVFDFLLFDDQQAGIVPIVLFDFDFQPSGGLHFFHNALGSDDHALAVWASTGGRRWFRGTIKDRWRLPHDRRLELVFDSWRRPDHLFYGFGPETPSSNRARYQRTFVDFEVRLRQGLWRSSSLTWTTRVGHNRFDDTDFGESPSVPEAVAAGVFPAPPGFARGYTVVENRLHASFDSRRPWPSEGGGVLVDGFVAHAFDAERFGANWVRFGGTLAGFHDLGGRRVLGAALHTRQARAVAGGDVPFTEVPRLGASPVLLGGFLPGRLHGQSMAVLALQYSYPVWVLADAALHVSVGNVFGEGYAGFAPERLRMSFGLGLKTNDNPDQAFTFQVAVGTETFGQGTRFDSLRLYLGLSQL